MSTHHYTQPDLPKVLAALSPPTELATAATYENGEVADAQWAGQAARRLSVEAVRFTEPDFTATQLRDGGWIDAEINGGQLGGLTLTGTSWRRVAVLRARASGAVFTETELRDVTFEDTKLDLANFRFAKLKNVEFIRCQLVDVSFSGTHLTDVTFTSCDLTAAEFSGAINKHVDLRSSVLASIKGIGGLAGATISAEQMIGLMPEFAADLNIKVEND